MGADLRCVTYCGLHCDLCAQRGRIPQQARALRESMVKEGFDLWGGEIPGFTDFWQFLTELTDPEKGCPGCRQGGGYPACQIRPCAREHQVEVCVDCVAYPCAKIRELARVYPTLISDGERLREVGLETWLKEQEQRGKTGFAYADIRYNVE